MNEYAIDKNFYDIFEGLEIDEKKIRNFLINFHELLSKKDEISENKIREQKNILKAELKDELTKELATKADIITIQKDINNLELKFSKEMENLELKMENLELKLDNKFNILDKKIDELEKRMNLKFEQVDRRFEIMDKRFEQIDKRLENIAIRMDRFMFWSLGLSVTSTLFIISFIFKFFEN